MKGTPVFPAMRLLRRGRPGAEPARREVQGHRHAGRSAACARASRTSASWPTIPQLYVKGEFVGGCDIVREMDARASCASCCTARASTPRPPDRRGVSSARTTAAGVTSLTAGAARIALGSDHGCARHRGQRLLRSCRVMLRRRGHRRHWFAKWYPRRRRAAATRSTSPSTPATPRSPPAASCAKLRHRRIPHKVVRDLPRYVATARQRAARQVHHHLPARPRPRPRISSLPSTPTSCGFGLRPGPRPTAPPPAPRCARRKSGSARPASCSGRPYDEL